MISDPRSLVLRALALAKRDASLSFPAKHMPIGHMRARAREANEPSPLMHSKIFGELDESIEQSEYFVLSPISALCFSHALSANG